MHGILVKTGKYRPNDEDNVTNLTFAADNFASAVDYVLQNFSDLEANK